MFIEMRFSLLWFIASYVWCWIVNADGLVTDGLVSFNQGLSIPDILLSTSRDKNCPPCFNCMLPVFTCKQFGQCNNFTGRCECPEGFGGDDCSEPLCGGLGAGANRPPREGDTCDCSSGWKGINCNMCTNNQSCNSFMPAGEAGTCYQGGIMVNKNYQQCQVTNKKILEILKGKIPQVTFDCNRTAEKCDFQFWVDQKESFYCALDHCEFQTPSDSSMGNSTKYNCQNIKCSCVPGRMLCGEAGSIDISDFLTESIKGPGDFNCDLSTGNCAFLEPAMNDLIKSVFGDEYITLGCSSSECIHYTEYPGYQAPIKGTKRGFVIAALVSSLLFVLTGTFLFKFFVERSQKAQGVGAIRLPTDNEGINKLIREHRPVSLQFKQVGYESGGINILEGVSSSIESGEILAIMGGSGAGKTTLLDILAKKHKTGTIHGSIYLNGKDVNDTRYRQLVGFVDQEDLLMPTLTVYETVLTSALLRLPRDMDEDAKKLRVLETLEELGILGIKDRFIGDEATRGISGGEKRRVAIACELVTSPPILFLDEPTSGLDSYNAFNVIESLVQLARTYHRTIVLTIHQPRSNIVALFDKLVLLAKGHLVYSGPMDTASNFFSEHGFSCPPGYNVADYLVDLTMQIDRKGRDDDRVVGEREESSNIPDEPEPTEPTEQDEPEDLHAPPRSSTQEYDSTREWRHLQSHQDEMTSETRTFKSPANKQWQPSLQALVEIYKQSTLADSELKKIDDIYANASSSSSTEDNSEDEILDTKINKASLFQQFVILSDRTFKNLYRNPMLLFTHYLIAVILAVFCGVLYYNVSNDISGFQNRLGLFFFLLALFGFSTLTTLNLFSSERIIFVRERANGYYQPISYYFSKVLFDIIPLRVLPPILLGLIVYPLVGLSTENGAFLKFLLILVLFNLTASSICLVIGIIIKDAGVASLVGCLVMLFSLLFAGLFLNQNSMPFGTKWFKYLSIFHYAYEALAVNEVRYLTLTEKKFGLSIEVPGATILSTFGFDSAALWNDVIGLSCFFGLFLIAGYVCMHFMLIERR